jgi:hypothetical protein
MTVFSQLLKPILAFMFKKVLALNLILASVAIIFTVVHHKEANKCRDYVFVGARGSGEMPGVGGIPNSFINTFDEASSKTFRRIALSYPADQYSAANYNNSVAIGVKSTEAQFTNGKVHRLMEKCKAMKVILIGYSQGGHVFHKWASEAKGEKYPNVSLVLIADPVRDPKINAVKDVLVSSSRLNHDSAAKCDPSACSGDWVTHWGPSLPIEDQWSDRIVSLCYAEDDVCSTDGLPGPPGENPHADKYVVKAIQKQTLQEAGVLE